MPWVPSRGLHHTGRSAPIVIRRGGAFEVTQSSLYVIVDTTFGPETITETTYTQARERLAALMDQVTDTREPVLIRRRSPRAGLSLPLDRPPG